MKWCVECGEAGKPEPATTTVDGDPLCVGHAKARGTVFNAEFIDRRMAEHKAMQQEPSAPKEKVMATKLCACGCGADMDGSAWNYKRGHNAAHKNGADVPAPKKAKELRIKKFNVGDVVVVGTAAAGDFVEYIWNALPRDLKVKLLRDALQ